jgi:hypothetical protein
MSNPLIIHFFLLIAIQVNESSLNSELMTPELLNYVVVKNIHWKMMLLLSTVIFPIISRSLTLILSLIKNVFFTIHDSYLISPPNVHSFSTNSHNVQSISQAYLSSIDKASHYSYELLMLSTYEFFLS